MQDSYTDLSHDIKNTADPGVTEANAVSEGKQSSGGFSFDFKADSGSFILDKIDIHDTKILDCVELASCGFTEYNGSECYLIAANTQMQAGFLFTLQTPVAADSVTGMTLTFMTEKDAPNASARVLKADASVNSDMVNDFGSSLLGGASGDWQTIDLLVKNVSSLASSDGYIHSFKFYVRDRTNIDYYIRNITFTADPGALCEITLSASDIRYEADAVSAVCSAIRERLSNAGIGAELKVTGVSYTPNTSAADGSLGYSVALTCGGETKNYEGFSTVIPALSGVWLNDEQSGCGSSHDCGEQYKTRFDKGGIISLSNNTVSCAEGIETFEYAVLRAGEDYLSCQSWYAPQALTLSDGGFSELYINAFLDLGEELIEGESYEFLIRAVSKNGNFILHLRVPFTFCAYSTSAQNALLNASKALKSASLSVDKADAGEMAKALEARIVNIINDSTVSVIITALGAGESSFVVCAALSYPGGVSLPRMASYTLSGEERQDFYNYAGSSFTFDTLSVSYSASSSSALTLLSPYDGQTDIYLINEQMKAFLRSNDKTTAAYADGKTENFAPLPIVFRWENPENGFYTLELSTDRTFTGALSYAVAGGEKEIYNLYIGAEYFWRVTSPSGIVSDVYRFTTAENQRRTVYAPGIPNIRDLGGIKTSDGKTVRQGLIYRSGWLDYVSDEGKDIMLNQLGIKTDLDLRGTSLEVSPLGENVRYFTVYMSWYDAIFVDKYKEAARQAISVFADAGNYPIDFHCSLGRDRAGTTAILILGLLDVDEEEIRRDYMLSWFSEMGGYDGNSSAQMNNIYTPFIKQLSSYKGTNYTFAQNVEHYLLDVGVTSAQIDSIRNILLED